MATVASATDEYARVKQVVTRAQTEVSAHVPDLEKDAVIEFAVRHTATPFQVNLLTDLL